jgi:hypothetical protein
MTRRNFGSAKVESRSSAKDRRLASSFAGFLLILLYPVLGMLWHHAYPVLSPEIGLIALGTVLIACTLALLLRYTGPGVGNLVISLLVTVAFMIHFNLLFVGLAAVLLVAVTLGFILKDRYGELVLIVFAALIVGSWLDSRLDPATRLTELQPLASDGNGPVVHILMDGFMAPDGLPKDEASEALRVEVLSFFQEYGFELHSRAYSHYNSTLDSMTRALNFRNDDANLFHQATVLREELAFRDNAWFEVLEGTGREIHVYQSESLDFCTVPTIRNLHCNVFPIPNLKTVNRDVNELRLRVEVLMRTLASQSVILTQILRDARILDTWGVSIYDERLLPKLATDLSTRPGDAFFAHVLIPHSPFVYTEDCSIDYEGESRTRWAYVGGGGANDPGSRQLRYRKYIAQSRCALKLLRQLFEDMKSEELFDQATVIVHGDHGSSAYVYGPYVQNMNRVTQRDLLEAFSTLFAVKWPAGQPTIVDEVKSLNLLMAGVAGRIAGGGVGAIGNAVETEPEPFIYMLGNEPLSRFYVNIFESPDQTRRHQ